MTLAGMWVCRQMRNSETCGFPSRTNLGKLTFNSRFFGFNDQLFIPSPEGNDPAEEQRIKWEERHPSDPRSLPGRERHTAGGAGGIFLEHRPEPG